LHVMCRTKPSPSLGLRTREDDEKAYVLLKTAPDGSERGTLWSGNGETCSLGTHLHLPAPRPLGHDLLGRAARQGAVSAPLRRSPAGGGINLLDFIVGMTSTTLWLCELPEKRSISLLSREVSPSRGLECESHKSTTDHWSAALRGANLRPLVTGHHWRHPETPFRWRPFRNAIPMAPIPMARAPSFCSVCSDQPGHA
jgi:hypothetical protein